MAEAQLLVALPSPAEPQTPFFRYAAPVAEGRWLSLAMEQRRYCSIVWWRGWGLAAVLTGPPP